MVISIIDYLEKIKNDYPDKIAFCDLEMQLSFTELVDASKRIASTIRKEVKKSKVPIVIFMKKGAHNIPSFFGSVYAGEFYVPIDMDMPDNRIQMIVDVLKPAGVIFDSNTEKKVLNDSIWNGICKFKYEDAVRTEITEDLLEAVRGEIKTTDILYVLFTSGSTGTPKGVTISHSAIIDFVEWICKEYNLHNDISLCNQAPFYFDASVPDIYIPLKTGATTYIPPKMYYSFPKKILQYIADKNINTLVWVPSALCNVVNCNAFDVCVPDSVRLVIFCGEVMPTRHLRVWREHLSNALYVNMYGPTEATYACTFFNIEREFSDDEKLPLGKNCGNCEIFLLTEDGKPAKTDEIGEICIAGQCLSNGYYNNWDKTREVFVQNPLNDRWIEYIYKTGDLATIDGEGQLVYVGRKDFQIKRLGHRIELGEIENAILSFSEVKQACCLFNPETSDIIAVFSGELAEKELSGRLKAKIPSYMLPTKYYALESVPMNINGKIDRVKLNEMYVKEKNNG